jgi:hypothetical protein
MRRLTKREYLDMQEDDFTPDFTHVFNYILADEVQINNQKQLAEQTGISENTISNWKVGQIKHPNREKIIQFLDGLKVDQVLVDTALHAARHPTKYGSSELEIQEYYKKVKNARPLVSRPRTHLEENKEANPIQPENVISPVMSDVSPRYSYPKILGSKRVIAGIVIMGIIFSALIFTFRRPPSQQQMAHTIEGGFRCAVENDLAIIQDPRDKDLLSPCWTQTGAEDYSKELEVVYLLKDLHACRSSDLRPTAEIEQFEVKSSSDSTAEIEAIVHWIVTRCTSSDQIYCASGWHEYRMLTKATLIREGDIWKMHRRIEDRVGSYITNEVYCQLREKGEVSLTPTP